MLSFFNEPTLKAALLARMDDHAEADAFLQGTYWREGKGCFIGCAIHGDDPMKFEQQYGLSVFVAKLGEYYFERADRDDAILMPRAIIDAIPVGVETHWVWPRLWQWIVTAPVHGLLASPIRQCSKDLLKATCRIYEAWPQTDQAAAEAAAWGARAASRAAAEAAAWGAEAAAGDAAFAAAWAARDAALAAAVAAAWAAEAAAWAAEAAAGDAAFAAAVAATRAAEAATRGAACSAARAAARAEQYQVFLTILRGLGEETPLVPCIEQPTRAFAPL